MALRLRLPLLVTLTAMPFVIAGILPAIGSHFWLCDLCAHATAQTAIALCLGCIALLLIRRFGFAFFLLPFALLASVRTAQLFCGGEPLQTPALRARQPLRCAAINLLVDNEDAAAVLCACKSEHFDIITTSELTDRWVLDLAPLRAQFPHFIGKPSGIFGIGLWSRHPLRGAQVIPLGVDWAPAIRAEVDAPQGTFSVLAVHLPRASLFGQAFTDNRDLALQAIPLVLARLPKPRVLLGDCNATRWTAAYASMQKASGLFDTSDGAGWQPTWPTSLPSLLRIPIDQALIEPTLHLRRRWLGPHTGSDHLPICIEFDLPQ